MRLAITPANRRWWVLATMVGALSMLMLDTTVVSVALPTIEHDLGVSQTGVQWIVNAYLLAFAALVAVGGRLADLIGAERTFRAGAGIFIAASAACGVAPSAAVLVAARAVQGAGAAMMAPATSAIIMNAFGPSERGRAMGIYSGVSMIFLALGPLIGGTLTDLVSWRAVFFVNLPIGMLMLALARVTLPRPSAARSLAGMDWFGTALLVGSLGALVLGLMQGSSWGWESSAVVGLLGVGVVLLPPFVWWERRHPRPLVDLSLLGEGSFATVGAVLASVQFALTGVTIFGAIWVQGALGYEPITAGLSLLPLTLSLLICAPLAGRLYDRIGARIPLTAGSLLVAGGLASLAAVLADRRYELIVPGYVAIGIGLGLTISPGSTDAIATAPPPLRGAASGLVQTLRQVGGTVGIAVLGAIVAHVLADGGASRAVVQSAAVADAYWVAAMLMLAAAIGAAALIRPQARASADPAPAGAAVAAEAPV
jgi:EmrB/QacA subfamily drug resistance transporter